MKTFLRGLGIVLEVTIAVAIFVMLAQKTPLFDRVIPGRSASKEKITQTTNPTTGTIQTGYSNTQYIAKNTQKPVTATISKPTYIVEQPVESGISCTTPRGEYISDGSSVIAYHAQTANSNNECQSEIRTCQNGIFGGTYKYETCNYVIDGQIITPSGIKKDVVPGASDETQKLITLSTFTEKIKSTPKEFIQPKPYTDTATLTIAQARPQTMTNSTYKEAIIYKDTLDQKTTQEDHTQYKAACRAPRGDRIRNGGYIYAYNRPYNTNATQCLREKRACNDGRLAGSYQYKSCIYRETKNDTTKITSIPSQIYKGTISSYSPSIRPLNEAIRDTILTSYSTSKSQSTTTTLHCIAPWGTTVSNGSLIKAYRLPHETNNSLCDSETRLCRSGVLGGSYIYPSCETQSKTTSTTTTQTNNNDTWIDRNLRSLGQDLNDIYVNSRAERNIESIGNDIDTIYTNSRTDRNIKSAANDIDTIYTNSRTDRNIKSATNDIDTIYTNSRTDRNVKSTANDIDTIYTNSRTDRNVKSIVEDTNSVRGRVQGWFK